MKKLLKAHEEKDTKEKADVVKEGLLQPYLLDREKQSNSKILTKSVK